MENRNEVLGLDHVVLRVRDLAKSVAFYRAIMGARVERQLRVPRIVQLRIGEREFGQRDPGAGATGVEQAPGGGFDAFIKGRGRRHFAFHDSRICLPSRISRARGRFAVASPAP